MRDLSGLKHRTCASAPDKPSRPGDSNVISLMILDWNHKNLKILLYTGTRRVSARQILEDLFVLSDIELRANEEPEFIEQI